MKLNPLTQIDFYKADHRRQYPEGTTLVYSNFTPRSSRLTNLPEEQKQIVFFGLQYFIKSFLIDDWNEGFFRRPKKDVVEEYRRRMDTSLGPGAIPVDHIEALHDLGYLPIEIRALPEGSKVDIRTPCLTIHNTHPDFFWLVNYLESVMSCYLWKPCVSATTAAWYKEVFDKYAEETSSFPDFTGFQGHDFSFRGMSGPQDAALSGAGHLLSFVGTDTVPAIDLLEQYYHGDADKELIGCSVPATEHSVMSMGASEDGEFEVFRRLITEVYPSGIVSIVSDTFDFWAVLTEYMPMLKEQIMAREGNPIANKVVIRPDSGDPVKIICGDPLSSDPIISKGAIELLWDTFGGTTNEKGYKELHPSVGLIYGDSITPQRALDILEGLKAKGFASTNVVLGIGSYTYQYVTRDTYGFAVKATYGQVNGEGRDIYKDPVTDSGTKKSARGIIKIIDGTFFDEVKGDTPDGPMSFDKLMATECDLKIVFKDGTLMKDQTLSEIRENVTRVSV